jgi:hypothetical protein
VLDAEEHPPDEYGERVVPVLDVDVGDGPEGPADPGVVEDDVELAERLDGEGHHGGDVVLGGHVDPDRAGGVGAVAGRRRLGLVGGHAVGVEVGHDHLRALVEERQRGGLAHPAGPAGDDRHLALQPISHGSDRSRARSGRGRVLLAGDP